MLIVSTCQGSVLIALFILSLVMGAVWGCEQHVGPCWLEPLPPMSGHRHTICTRKGEVQSQIGPKEEATILIDLGAKTEQSTTKYACSAQLHDFLKR
jgi:hypothetical protein